MTPHEDVDELFDIRILFYIGNYLQCIKEAQKLKPSAPDVRLERDVYLYRSYIAQRKFGVVLDEVHGASPSELQSIRRYADYLANHSKRDSIVIALDEQFSTSINVGNVTSVLMSASIYFHENNYEAALRILRQADNLECSSMMIQIYLSMDRLDLARKELKAMQEKDDDATLTQLAQAWVNNATGGDKMKEASVIYQELMDKNSSTPLLLNGQASALLGLGKLDQAESALQDALDKDSNDAETLVNMIVLGQMMGKPPEESNRYLSQLKDGHACHPFVKTFLAKEKEFDNVVQSYTKVA